MSLVRECARGRARVDSGARAHAFWQVGLRCEAGGTMGVRAQSCVRGGNQGWGPRGRGHR